MSFTDMLFHLVTIIFIVSIVLIIAGPYYFNDRYYMSFNDSLKKNYRRLNSKKTFVLLSLHVVVYVFFIYIILYNVLSLQNSLILIFTVGLFWLLFFLYYMPCQTPFGLTNFGTIYEPQNNSAQSVTTFLAIGDPQEFGANLDRYKNNKLAVKTMNTFINETYPTLKKSNMTDLLGCLIPGDCTQTGQDGRIFTNNYLCIN